MTPATLLHEVSLILKYGQGFQEFLLILNLPTAKERKKPHSFMTLA